MRIAHKITAEVGEHSQCCNFRPIVLHPVRLRDNEAQDFLPIWKADRLTEGFVHARASGLRNTVKEYSLDDGQQCQLKDTPFRRHHNSETSQELLEVEVNEVNQYSIFI